MASNFAPKKVSLAFGPKPPKPLNGIKRSHAALHDSDDEDGGNSQHHEISFFDQAAGGAIHASGSSNKKGAPLVIPALPNHDRLEYGRKKRQRSGLPAEINGNDIDVTKKEVTYGL